MSEKDYSDTRSNPGLLLDPSNKNNGYKPQQIGKAEKISSNKDAELTKWKPEDSNLDESDYRNYFDGNVRKDPAQDFAEFYRDHIKALFDEFRDPIKNKVDKNQFIEYLKESSKKKKKK